MKAGWELKRLSEVLVRTETVNPALKPEVAFDYIDVSSISNSTYQIEQTQQLKGKDAPSRARKLVRTNDILFATIRPTLKRIAIVPKNLDQQICSTGYFVLRPDNTLTHKYLYYYLFTDAFMLQMETLQKGASYPAVTDEEVRTQFIAYPPLPEQRRIVAILDEAFAGIATATANAERNLNNARELFESYLESVLSNPNYKIKNLGDISLGIQYGTSSKSKLTGKVPVLRMGNIQDGRFSWEDLVFCSNEDEIQKYSLKYNDVLFNRTNSLELVGKTAIYKGEMPAIFAGYLIRINRNETMIDSDYLNYFLNSKRASKYGRTVVTSSVHQANINATKLMSYPVPTPTLSEQKTIVSKLNELQAESKKLQIIYHQKELALTQLKQSILHQAFSGQLH